MPTPFSLRRGPLHRADRPKQRETALVAQRLGRARRTGPSDSLSFARGGSSFSSKPNTKARGIRATHNTPMTWRVSVRGKTLISWRVCNHHPLRQHPPTPADARMEPGVHRRKSRSLHAPLSGHRSRSARRATARDHRENCEGAARSTMGTVAAGKISRARTPTR